MFCKPKCNKDLTLDKWIAQEPDLKPLHLDSPVVIVLEFPLRYQVIGKGQQFVVSTKTMHVTLFLLQRYLVGSRYKYIPNDTAEVCCNTHLDKLPTKPKKSHFNHTALKFWVR